MNVLPTALEGVLIIEPTVFKDGRGFFAETYHAERYAEAGIDVEFVQDNHSKSVKNVLRGLHFQKKGRAQGKLVRCVRGRIMDVAVDIRRDSPSFGKWAILELSAENSMMLYVPEGFAHGFLVLSPSAEIMYKCTREYAPDSEGGIIWNDPRLGIPWPVRKPILSGKDKANPTLEEAESSL